MQADDLYGLPLDEFIPQRGALAKALRAEKRRDEAAQVAGLRKPSIAAWAVNQLVRTQHDSVQALFDAGDGLRGAQEDLLAGSGDGRKLRAAGEREREAVDTLVEAARGLLTSRGYELSAAVVERVDETLHAAALNEEAREQVRDGRLERELRHVGLGLGSGEALSATPTARAPKGASGSSDEAPSKEASGSGKRGGRGSAKESAKAGPAAERKDAGAKPPAVARADAKRAADPEATRAQEDAEAKRAQEERAEAEAKRAKEERAEAERAKRERAAARKAARAAETAAGRRADATARALEKAQRRRESAALALREADDALANARDDADEATAEHERAKAALDDL